MTKLREASTWVRSRYPYPITTGVVLGSGLSMDSELLSNSVTVAYSEIPHFPQPKVSGHGGKLTLGKTSTGAHVALFHGRVHYYEGHDAESVVFPIRLLRLLEAKSLIVTNAAGGVNPDFSPGDLMLITDHLNLTGFNPLRGDNLDELGPRFPDMTRAYSPQWQADCQNIANALNIPLQQGVYAGVSGPSYETPAEIRMLQTLGASAVGMSTVAETIVAQHSGLEVLGISMISNLAAGLGNADPLSHEDVLAVGKEASRALARLIEALLKRSGSP
jgi:purine-nucleoside phosphorylase